MPTTLALIPGGIYKSAKRFTGKNPNSFDVYPESYNQCDVLFP